MNALDLRVNDKLGVLICEMGLTVDSVFVPWSKSRNASEKMPSLNWKVTLKVKGRDVLTTDYMAGMAHCPIYGKLGGKLYSGRNLSTWGYDRIEAECENGFALLGNGEGETLSKIPILPDARDVIYSLVTDAEAFEYDFEDWAANLGMDTDSRRTEKMYNECLLIGLAIVRAIGTDGLAKLREAFQDY